VGDAGDGRTGWGGLGEEGFEEKAASEDEAEGAARALEAGWDETHGKTPRVASITHISDARCGAPGMLEGKESNPTINERRSTLVDHRAPTPFKDKYGDSGCARMTTKTRMTTVGENDGGQESGFARPPGYFQRK